MSTAANQRFLTYKEKVRIEKIVRTLQKKVWIYAGRPRGIAIKDLFSPERIAKFLGYYYDEKESVNDPLDPKNTETAGIIDSRNKTILISYQFSTVVRLFTAAHEIGHAVLHPNGVYHRDKPKNGSIKYHRDIKEQEADYFAACLLMPRKTVLSYFENNFGRLPLAINTSTAFSLNPANPDSILNTKRGDVEKYISSVTRYNSKKFDSLSEAFGVSPYAMSYRLEELKVISYIEVKKTSVTKTTQALTTTKSQKKNHDSPEPLVKIGNLMSGAQLVQKRGGNACTWQGYLEYSDGTHSPAYVKDIKKEQVAKELLLAVIAKEIGLPITQACLVSVSPNKLPNNTARKFIFGLEDARALPISNRITLGKKIANWPLFLLCAVFDSWIGNDDRLPSNLLFNEKDGFYLIDHGDALKKPITKDTVTKNNLILYYKESTNLNPQLLLNHLIEESHILKNIDFNKVKREIISSNGVVRSQHIDPFIDLLKKRLERLPDILNTQVNHTK